MLDISEVRWYNLLVINRRGVAQLVARDIWDVEAAGSKPVTPTISKGNARHPP